MSQEYQQMSFSLEDFTKVLEIMTSVWKKLKAVIQDMFKALTQSFQNLLPYLITYKKHKRLCWLAVHGKNARIRKKNLKRLNKELDKIKEEYHGYIK